MAEAARGARPSHGRARWAVSCTGGSFRRGVDSRSLRAARGRTPARRISSVLMWRSGAVRSRRRARTSEGERQAFRAVPVVTGNISTRLEQLHGPARRGGGSGHRRRSGGAQLTRANASGLQGPSGVTVSLAKERRDRTCTPESMRTAIIYCIGPPTAGRSRYPMAAGPVRLGHAIRSLFSLIYTARSARRDRRQLNRQLLLESLQLRRTIRAGRPGHGQLPGRLHLDNSLCQLQRIISQLRAARAPPVAPRRALRARAGTSTAGAAGSP